MVSFRQVFRSPRVAARFAREKRTNGQNAAVFEIKDRFVVLWSAGYISNKSYDLTPRSEKRVKTRT